MRECILSAAVFSESDFEAYGSEAGTHAFWIGRNCRPLPSQWTPTTSASSRVSLLHVGIQLIYLAAQGCVI